MKRSPALKSRIAFTLVELLVVISIIALLMTLSFPAANNMIRKAKGVVCAQNLKDIGIAVQTYVGDHNNTYPEINQTAPPLPYPADVQGLVGVLSDYGVTTNQIQCPVDMGLGTASSFTKYGSSYEWAPIIDDEDANSPTVYPRAGMSFPVKASRTRLCTDFNKIHNGRQNALYADGHVVAK